MRHNGRMVEEISDLAGLARTKPAMAFFFALLMFSLAGIPPLAGFFAKYYVFLAAIKANLFALAVIGVVTSVVGAYYYLLIVKTIYFDDPMKSFEPMPLEQEVVLTVAGGCSISCSSSIRRRCWMPRRLPPNRCSDEMAFALGLARDAGRAPARSLRQPRFHEFCGLVARARGRARPALDRDARRRPPGAAAAGVTWSERTRAISPASLLIDHGRCSGRRCDAWICRGPRAR